MQADVNKKIEVVRTGGSSQANIAKAAAVINQGVQMMKRRISDLENAVRTLASNRQMSAFFLPMSHFLFQYF